MLEFFIASTIILYLAIAAISYMLDEVGKNVSGFFSPFGIKNGQEKTNLRRIIEALLWLPIMLVGVYLWLLGYTVIFFSWLGKKG